MSKRPYYTSTELIDAVKRKISMPITQLLFTADDILNFANEELFLSQVPSILTHHEEYLVYSESIALVTNTNNYPIPKRAIGMKLRDLYYVDTQEDMHEMTNVGLSNAEYYGNTSGNLTTPRNYYLQADDIVLLPKITTITGSILAKYYLRPNSLVENDRAAICTNFVKEIVLGTLVSGNTITINGNELVAGTDFAVGASATASASNLTNAINTLDLDGITATASATEVNINYELQSTTITSNSANIVVSDNIGIECTTIPDHFVDGMYVDFLQTDGGHKTYSFDVKIPRDGISANVIFFDSALIPVKFVIGDYLCEQNECIIPQIPSDLHNLLAERTCARILESLGDYEGAAKQDTKVDKLEFKQATLITNRTESSPKKIFNRHSLLRSAKQRRF